MKMTELKFIVKFQLFSVHLLYAKFNIHWQFVGKSRFDNYKYHPFWLLIVLSLFSDTTSSDIKDLFDIHLLAPNVGSYRAKKVRKNWFLTNETPP